MGLRGVGEGIPSAGVHIDLPVLDKEKDLG
jgi:hypothetical protein